MRNVNQKIGYQIKQLQAKQLKKKYITLIAFAVILFGSLLIAMAVARGNTSLLLVYLVSGIILMASTLIAYFIIKHSPKLKKKIAKERKYNIQRR